MVVGGEAQKVASPSMHPAPLSVPERGWGGGLLPKRRVQVAARFVQGELEHALHF